MGDGLQMQPETVHPGRSGAHSAEEKAGENCSTEGSGRKTLPRRRKGRGTDQDAEQIVGGPAEGPDPQAGRGIQEGIQKKPAEDRGGEAARSDRIAQRAAQKKG